MLADAHGNVIHLGERDCTIQRRHQKLVEETPSPAVGARAARADRPASPSTPRAPPATARRGRSRGCSTPDGDYFFMEMNTRIQVEHTVTELVTGLDLVREQVLVAAGEPLSLRQEDVVLRGHAIECRINAEDPVARLPARAPGRITRYREPAGPACASTRASRAGSEISGLYDPMIAKLIVHDTDRETARRRMLRALGEFEIGGVKSLLGFHQALLGHPCFVAGETCHGLVESEELAEQAREFSHRATTVAAAADGLLSVQATRLKQTVAEVDGRRVEVKVLVPGAALPRARAPAARACGGRGRGRRRRSSSARCRERCSTSRSSAGDVVEVGQVICIVEAMKMENEVVAHKAGVVADVAVATGAAVTTGQAICAIETPE